MKRIRLLRRLSRLAGSYWGEVRVTDLSTNPMLRSEAGGGRRTAALGPAASAMEGNFPTFMLCQIILSVLFLTHQGSSTTHFPKAPVFSVHGGIRTVRVYQTDITSQDKPADSVNEEFSDESELSKSHDVILASLEYNTERLDENISSFKLRNVSVCDGREICLIERPTASHISHKLLNPYLYRNVKDLGSLDDFAQFIGAPTSWEYTFEQKVRWSPVVFKQFRDLQKLPDNAPEALIQECLSSLMLSLGACLANGDLYARRETQVIVGGILAREEFDIRGQVDPYYLNHNGQYVLGTEVKTHESFGKQEVWYHKSRGAQQQFSPSIVRYFC